MKKLQLNYDKVFENYDSIVSEIGERFKLGDFLHYLIMSSCSKCLFKYNTEENRYLMSRSLKKCLFYYFETEVDVVYKESGFIFNDVEIDVNEVIDLKKIIREQKLKNIK